MLNFIVNPDRQTKWADQKITSQHLLDTVEHKKRKQKTSQRAVEVCSKEVLNVICQCSFPFEETIGTRMYLSMCALLKIMNNSTDIYIFLKLQRACQNLNSVHKKNGTMKSRPGSKKYWKNLHRLYKIYKGISWVSTVNSDNLSWWGYNFKNNV